MESAVGGHEWREGRARGDSVARARALGERGQRTVLFIDEVHRFNKSQQDLLLPATETGEVVLIGATTENPYFEVNAALMSRTTLWRLQPLGEGDLATLVRRGLALRGATITDEALARPRRRAPTATRAARSPPSTRRSSLARLERSDERHASSVARGASARRPALPPVAPTRTTTRSAPSSNRCAVRTPTPRSTGSSRCSRAARVHGSSRGAS